MTITCDQCGGPADKADIRRHAPEYETGACTDEVICAPCEYDKAVGRDETYCVCCDSRIGPGDVGPVCGLCSQQAEEMALEDGWRHNPAAFVEVRA